MRHCAWLVSCWLGAALPATAACPLPKPALQQGEAQVAWKVDGASLAVGKHFAMEVLVCPADAMLARVDATMPEHKHGMNYRPSLKSLGDGRWRVEGLMFHMPGRWELRLEVRTAGRTEVLVDSLHLQ
jgi:hypothetical protein